MGMFDSVYARCPGCSGEVEFQSKAGSCELKRYSMDSVPPEIAQALSGETATCRSCGGLVTLALTQPIGRVQMVVDAPGEWD